MSMKMDYRKLVTLGVITFFGIGNATVAQAATLHVDAKRPNDTGSGENWATAKKSIQAAVDAAVAGDTIFVTNGVYAPISTDNKSIVIRSVNGAKETIIDGNRKTRCATLGTSEGHKNTMLVGFTLKNGVALGFPDGTSGGGGVIFGTLNDCVLIDNRTDDAGGGAKFSTLNNCLLWKNSSNKAGGGTQACVLNNCTVVRNRTGNYPSGGGVHGGTVNNSIVWGNSSSGGEDTANLVYATASYSCIVPLQPGKGNIAKNPMFANSGMGDFRLGPKSPCINAGDNSFVIEEFDIEGNPRILDDIVDMGAYEYVEKDPAVLFRKKNQMKEGGR